MATSALPHSARPRELESLDGSSELWQTIKTILSPVSSLKLTVVLMALAIVIIFIGTLAQTQNDIWQVMREYFRAWIMRVEVNTLFPRSFFPRQSNIPGVFYFPGGALVGSLMALNLLAAHLVRFKVQAQGARLVAGMVVIAAGMMLTLAVIFGDLVKATAQDTPLLAWANVWHLLVLTLLATGLGCVGAAIFQPRAALDEVGRGLLFAGGGVCLAAFLWVLVNSLRGTPIEPAVATLRILWQLFLACTCGTVLLIGCWLVFKQRGGIVLLHSGVALMMVGEALVAYLAVESQMRLVEGATSNYTYDIRSTELALVDSADQEQDHIIAIPERLLHQSETAKAVVPDGGQQLPLQVKVVKYLRNHELLTLDEARERAAEESKKNDSKSSEFENPATAGLGLEYVAWERPHAKGTDSGGEVDFAAAYVQFADKNGKELGTYLLSQVASEASTHPGEKLKVGDQTYDASLRFKRYYHPFTVTLHDARQDNYVGTNVPRNYSSDVRLVDRRAGVDMDPRIWMNNPLRYGGHTFYQSQFAHDPGSNVDITTLAVVTNLGWMIPYVSCALVGIGMLAHFVGTLYRFLVKFTGRSTGDEVANAELVEEAAPGRGKRPVKRPASKSLGERLWENIADPGSAALALAACIFFAIIVWPLSRAPKSKPGEMDLVSFGRLPVADKGRVKPLDTLARTSLRVISNVETYKDEKGKTQPAIRWLAELMTGSPEFHDAKVFRIEHPEVLSLFSLEHRPGKYRYSLAELEPHLQKFEEQAKAAHDKRPEDLDVYQKKLLELDSRLRLMIQLISSFRPQLPRLPDPKEFSADPEGARQQIAEFKFAQQEVVKRKEFVKPALVIPQEAPAGKNIADDWESYPVAWAAAYPLVYVKQFEPPNKADRPKDNEPDPAAVAFHEILVAYANRDAENFNREVSRFARLVDDRAPREYNAAKLDKELRFNSFSPFFYGYWLYVIASVFAAVGALAWFWNKQISAGTWVFLLLVFGLHSYALLERMLISGRPPVTNLYSSAVFIGWGAVGLGLLLELSARLIWGSGFGLGNELAAAAGASTLYIAHLLSNDGDTMIVLQAVLDTNFWLMTHVTCVTLGYATTFVAGLLGIAYILLGLFTPALRASVNGPARNPAVVSAITGSNVVTIPARNLALQLSLGRLLFNWIYGVLCFAIFFSFVGTVLGGLWADDSWGRFWGWDPKENGALMIVLWNALVLHARWGGMVKERGLAVLAVGGNIVTAWSWFGVNELGVGLHSYGFTEGVLLALGGFVLSQIVVIGLGCLPKSLWWSFRTPQAA